MNVNLFMLLVPSHKFLRVLQRLLEGVGVGPGEIGSVGLAVEVRKGVREFDLEIALIVPVERTLAPLPLH